MASHSEPSGRTPSSTTSLFPSFFSRPTPLYLSAALLRLVFLLYGLWQDANSPVKYTDIDYLVFTDAARFVSRGQSPYERETYRYTPILAWLLLPTAHKTGHALLDTALFSSGKVLFAAADLVAGRLIERILAKSMDAAAARRFAAIWLLNPMVATISTRGSSEGLLGVLVMALLSAVMAKRITLAGLLLGFGVHFKIYPFIYAPAVVWWMDREKTGNGRPETKESPATMPLLSKLTAFITPARLQLAAISLAAFLALNMAMFTM
jgi:phosphatidylinositol glycan class M